MDNENKKDNQEDIKAKYFDMMGEILVLDVRIIKGESHLQEEKDKKLRQATILDKGIIYSLIFCKVISIRASSFVHFFLVVCSTICLSSS